MILMWSSIIWKISNKGRTSITELKGEKERRQNFLVCLFKNTLSRNHLSFCFWKKVHINQPHMVAFDIFKNKYLYLRIFHIVQMYRGCAVKYLFHCYLMLSLLINGNKMAKHFYPHNYFPHHVVIQHFRTISIFVYIFWIFNKLKDLVHFF